jgi:hypothetical protein
VESIVGFHKLLHLNGHKVSTRFYTSQFC